MPSISISTAQLPRMLWHADNSSFFKLKNSQLSAALTCSKSSSCACTDASFACSSSFFR